MKFRVFHFFITGVLLLLTQDAISGQGSSETKIARPELVLLAGRVPAIKAIALDPGGKLLAVAGADPAIRVFELKDGRLKWQLAGHAHHANSLSFSRNGRWLASTDNFEARVWDLERGETVQVIKTLHRSRAAFVGDGSRLALGGVSGKLRIFKVETGKLESELKHDLYGGYSDTELVESDSDGRFIAASGQPLSFFRLWNPLQGKSLGFATESVVAALAFSPDGNWLAAATHQGFIHRLEVSTGRIRATNASNGRPLLAVAIGENGTRTAVGGDDGTIRILESGGKPTRTFSGSGAAVTALAFCSQDRCLLSGGRDGAVRIWDVSTGKQMAVLVFSAGSNNWAIVTSEGLLDGSEAGLARLAAWSIRGDRYPLERFNDLHRHVGLLASLVAGNHPKPKVDIANIQQPPRVRIVKPTGGSEEESDSTEILVRSEAGAGRMARLRISVNGKAVETRDAQPVPTAEYAFRVPLAKGENTIAAVGLNSQGVSGIPDFIRVYSPMDSSLNESKPELVLQTGHVSLEAFQGFAPREAFSRDCSLLATAGADHTILIWDVASGNELRMLRGHADSVRTVAFSPDGRLIASGGSDNTLRLWAVRSGELLWTLPLESVNAVDISPDARTIASAGNVLRLIHVLSGSEMRTLKGGVEVTRESEGVWTVAFSSDGRMLASGGRDRVVHIWDAESGRELAMLRGHTAGIQKIVFSPDGRWIASLDTDGFVRLWDPAGKVQVDSSSHSGKNKVIDIFFRPDSLALVTTVDSMVHIRDLPSLREDRRLQARVRPVAFAPDGRLLSSLGETLVVSGDAIDRVNKTPRTLGATEAVEAIALNPDGRWMVASRFRVRPGPNLALWELSTGREVRGLQIKYDGKRSLKFTPDGRWLVAGDNNYNRGVDLLQLDTGDNFISAEREGIGSLSADGRVGATMRTTSLTPPAMQVTLWNVETGKKTGAIPIVGEGAAGMYSLTLSPDGSWLALEGAKSSIMGDCNRIWVFNTASGKGYSFQTRTGCGGDIAFTPDGRWLLVRGVFHEVATGRKLHEIVEEAGGTFSPDGRYLATTPDSNFVNLFNVADGKLLHTFSISSVGGSIPDVEFSTDGRFLAATARDAVKIWDPSTGKELHTLGPEKANAIAFSRDSRWLWSAGAEGVKLWDLTSGELQATLISLKEGGAWLAIAPDGLFDGSAGGWKRILWRFGGDTLSTAPMEAFFSDFYHPGLVGEILSGNRPMARRNVGQLDRRQPKLKLDLVDSQQPHARVVRVRVNVMEASPDRTHPSGSGARDVRLFRNGSLVHAWHGDVLNGSRSTTLEASVSITAGPNRFVAYAFNHDNVKSGDAELTVVGPETIRRKGSAYILAIGINRYSNPDYNLCFAVADAQAFGEELQRQQREFAIFDRVEVIGLYDKEATRANMLRALAIMAGADHTASRDDAPSALAKLKRAEPEDVVFVYFAGHGTARGPRFHLLPHDLGYTGKRAELEPAALNTIIEHSISDLDLEQAFEKIDAGRILLTIDACNSGQALEAEEKRRGPMNSKGLAQLAYEKGMYVLTAAQGYQAALEAVQLGHGLLTYALVEEGLKTASADFQPKDGEVMLREWLDYATLRVPQLQETVMKEASKLGRAIAIVDGEEKIREIARRSLQRPRVFYVRELESEPLVVARPYMVKRPSVSTAEETQRDGRFIAYNNGTVSDTRTGLMWAAKDNGGNINWTDAKSYCENYRGGGYTDWRMPTQDELAGLYDAGKSRQAACNKSYPIHVATELIDITCFFFWASETRGSAAASFGFSSGRRDWGPRSGTGSGGLALPVRSGK